MKTVLWKQEPVAWRDPATDDIVSVARRAAWETDYGLGGKGRAATYTEPLYTAPPRRETEQEPVAWVDEASIAWLAEHPRGIITTRLVKQKSPERQMAMYAEPPRREWRGLTMQEINALPEVGGRMWNMGVAEAVLQAIRAVEAKLKEKNA